MNVLEILGISPEDSLDIVKKRYRLLSLKYHPDKNSSPSAPKIFQEIQDAYKSVCNNPSLLNPKKLEYSKSKGFIQTELNVTVEDIYFYREHTVCIDRLIVCTKCEGTGSKHGKKGLCEHCQGKGVLSSNVFKLLGTSNICPVCDGAGKNNEDFCIQCRGNRYIIERQNYKVKIGLKDYHKGFKILKGYGNEYETGKFSDVHIRLNIFYDNILSIENFKFVCNVLVTPVQNIIGDEQSLSIYGKEITYRVIPGEPEYEYLDIRPGMPDRTLRFLYTEKKPRVIEETKIIYEKLKKIERVLGLIREEN